MSFNNRTIIFICIFIVILTLCTACVFNTDDLVEYVYKIITWPHANKILWIAVITTFATQFIVNLFDKKKHDLFIWKIFKKFTEPLYSIPTFGIAATTSLALFKGFYLQVIMDKGKYFNELETVDLWSLGIVSGFLLFYSLYSIVTALLQTASKFTSREVKAAP